MPTMPTSSGFRDDELDGAARAGREAPAAGSSVHLAEVLKAGFSAGAVSCTSPSLTTQTGSAGAVDVTVHKDETWTCTFSNTTNTATGKLMKKVDGTQTHGWGIDARGRGAPRAWP